MYAATPSGVILLEQMKLEMAALRRSQSNVDHRVVWSSHAGLCTPTAFYPSRALDPDDKMSLRICVGSPELSVAQIMFLLYVYGRSAALLSPVFSEHTAHPSTRLIRAHGPQRTRVTLVHEVRPFSVVHLRSLTVPSVCLMFVCVLERSSVIHEKKVYLKRVVCAMDSTRHFLSCWSIP